MSEVAPDIPRSDEPPSPSAGVQFLLNSAQTAKDTVIGLTQSSPRFHSDRQFTIDRDAGEVLIDDMSSPERGFQTRVNGTVEALCSQMQQTLVSLDARLRESPAAETERTITGVSNDIRAFMDFADRLRRRNPQKPA